MADELIEYKKVIVFQLREEEYAVSVEQVGSIERIQAITRVPQTADFIKGVINLRGVVTPVLDLRTRFDMAEIEYNDATRIIIVYLDDMEVGLIVDGAKDVIDINVNDIEPPPEVIGTVDIDFIEGVIKLEDRLLILLNLTKVLTNQELEELKTVEG